MKGFADWHLASRLKRYGLNIESSDVASGDQRRSRFGRLIERDDGSDFPFYDGNPVEIEAWKWLLVILAAMSGFAALG